MVGLTSSMVLCNGSQGLDNTDVCGVVLAKFIINASNFVLKQF